MSDTLIFPRELHLIHVPLAGLPDRVRVEDGHGNRLSLGADCADALEKAAAWWRQRRDEERRQQRDGGRLP